MIICLFTELFILVVVGVRVWFDIWVRICIWISETLLHLYWRLIGQILFSLLHFDILTFKKSFQNTYLFYFSFSFRCVACCSTHPTTHKHTHTPLFPQVNAITTTAHSTGTSVDGPNFICLSIVYSWTVSSIFVSMKRKLGTGEARLIYCHHHILWDSYSSWRLIGLIHNICLGFYPWKELYLTVDVIFWAWTSLTRGPHEDTCFFSSSSQ